MKMRAIFLTLLVVLGVSLSGCSGGNDEEDWKETGTFTEKEMIMYGKEGKFGLVKVNGEETEPAFPFAEGRHYDVYFLDDSVDVSGKKYLMTALHKETNETIYLYKWGIDHNKSGAKFALGREGLWRIDVEVDGEAYTSFVVKAEKE
ncbi:hypothetical protein HF072_05200 [Bacillus sp. RO3]|nr:hypothetical protein [Bacillus sp. RO3]